MWQLNFVLILFDTGVWIYVLTDFLDAANSLAYSKIFSNRAYLMQRIGDHKQKRTPFLLMFFHPNKSNLSRFYILFSSSLSVTAAHFINVFFCSSCHQQFIPPSCVTPGEWRILPVSPRVQVPKPRGGIIGVNAANRRKKHVWQTRNLLARHNYGLSVTRVPITFTCLELWCIVDMNTEDIL